MIVDRRHLISLVSVGPVRRHWLLACVVATAAATLTASSPQSETEAYRAIVARMSAVSTLEMPRIAITIDSYTTSDDARALLAAQKTGGPRAWLAALRTMRKGVVSLPGERQGTIRAVHAMASDTKRRLVIMADHQSTAGARASSLSPDNQFDVIELTIDQAGKGTGQLLEAASVRLDDNGAPQVDSSTGVLWLLVEVEPVK